MAGKSDSGVRTGLVFVNPGSGGDNSPTVEEMASALEPCGLGVEEVHPADLADRTRAALEEGCRTIGVAGGDGTIRTVAQVLAGTDVPMLVVPAGTRNHFARELGIDTLEAAAGAARTGHVRQISVGAVNDRVFVNNASIGIYPALVRRREQRESHLSKRMAGLTAAAELLLRGEPLNVAVEGTHVEAWLVFIGNGRYGDGFMDIVDRESLESGTLDVRVLRADRRLARTRVAVDLAAGRLRRSPLVICHDTAQLDIGVEGRRIDVALDGEVVTIEAPLTFAVRPQALSVLSPPEES